MQPKKKKTLRLPTYLPRGGRASKFASKPISSHFFEFPLEILIGIGEARYQPYSNVPNFEVIPLLKIPTTTIDVIYVMLSKV